jgi:N-acetylglucosaminyldiphosphoundecaprenol N-acetyl-beta-D-mannosaminyltransferase
MVERKGLMAQHELFNINFEFDSSEVLELIRCSVVNGEKGYVCSVDGNNITHANSNEVFQEIIDNSLVNICDSSIAAFLASIIYKKRFNPYLGVDLFITLIKKCEYRSYFLGNNESVLIGLKRRLSTFDPSINDMMFQPLPFNMIDEFDYKGIAETINADGPDLIWVSLGAPKQEEFMSKLLPHIEKGVMAGVGAILNFYSDDSEELRAPITFQKFKLEWLYRTGSNPQKQLPKAISYIKILPRLIIHEVRKSKGIKNSL